MCAEETRGDERPAYTAEHVAGYPAEYVAGIDLYNAGEFYAAHDAWEDRWREKASGAEKLFLQALIQSAVAFYHLEAGRRVAARKMYLRAKDKFARLGRKQFMSLDLENYEARFDGALAWLLAAPDPLDLVPPGGASPPPIKLLPGVTEYD